jgi:flagellar biosynthetic protein FliQ
VTYGEVLSLGRDAILVAFYATGPVLLLGMVTGLVVSLFQSVTQLQEPTLTFIPKMLAAGLAVLLFGPFILAELTDFTTRVFSNLGNFIR